MSGPEREYQCRVCGYFLFETSLATGRIGGLFCKRCKKRVVVYLGPGSEHLRPIPREQDAYSAAS